VTAPASGHTFQRPHGIHSNSKGHIMETAVNSTHLSSRKSRTLKKLRLMAAVTCGLGVSFAATAAQAPVMLAAGLQGSSGSTVGPDGALYVAEGLVGRISRVDPGTGMVTTFAEGLPSWIIGVGGPIDVAFIDGTAYVLVTAVGFPFGGSINGIYRIDGPNSYTIIADLGAFSASNPPATPFDVPDGLQYALETFRGGFLVTDGHHNRVLRVTLEGDVSVFKEFGNIVPTGLEVHGRTVYMARPGRHRTRRRKARSCRSVQALPP
jgi:hypothetical protein